MYASFDGYIEIVELLISKGADVHAKDNDGDTALAWALYGEQTEMVEFLISKGAD